jgi:hypothetical protein
MAYLAVTDAQKAALQELNDASPWVKVVAVRGTQGGWLVDAPTDDAVFEPFAEWYAALTPTDDEPAPVVRPAPRTRPTPAQ